MSDQPDTYYTVQPGDTFHSLAHFYYLDRNKWLLIRQANAALQGFGQDQPLPALLRLTLPFIPELTTTILTEEGDTLGSLATFFYFSEHQWQRILQANPALQGFGQDQPLPAGRQLTLPFIPERTIILITNEGDTLQTFAKTYYDDENQWSRILQANPVLRGFGQDQPLLPGLQLTLPFIPEITTAILTAEGDTLGLLAKIYYNIENQWPRLRQVNPALQGFGADQPLPVGFQLTLPSFMADRVITTESGDTLRALGHTYHHTDDYWLRIRQLNPALQGFSPDEPLPVGFQLTFQSIPAAFRTIITGSNQTFMSLAQTFYHNANDWPVIRQANPPLQHINSNQILPTGISVTIP